ncbi:MAG: hypothetical protein ACLRZ9_02125 [Eubacterium sp.]
MYNICRPFTLYSDFLPPQRESDFWQYITWGDFDGMDIGDNIFEEGKWSFEKLWKYTEKKRRELNGCFSEQTIFAFRSENETNKADEEFWNEKE